MQNRSFFSYLKGSFVALVGGLVIGYFLGAWQGLLTVGLLSVLEISLSFDNAVVNAGILKNWDHRWRKLFLGVGIVVAVFGMRLVFPIVIVSATTSVGAWDVLQMAIYHADQYAAALTAVHAQVMAFGGAFLALVAFSFFIDVNKDEHWIPWLEKHLTRLGKIEGIGAAITLVCLLGVSHFLPVVEQPQFLVAGLFGIVTFVITRGLGALLGSEEGNGSAAKIVQQGIAGFVFLEILDASFSFDGVIGAFALTNNLFVIATGLGVGAFFVRSLTVYLVDKGALASLKYLEHGAFYAIAALAGIMFMNVLVEVPELVTGLLSAGFIGAAAIHSFLVLEREVPLGLEESAG